VKVFQQRDIKEAQLYALAGHQAVHLMSGSFAYIRKDTPNCFKNQKTIAHLFDQDETRLIATAKKLGVRVIKIERKGQPGQHIDLCGKPLLRALEQAETATSTST
jgi:hypothetical protein